MSSKILFVDDEPSVLEGYRRVLHREFCLQTAESGREALELISNSGPYSVIVSDMRMPGMDGVQVLAAVSEASPDTVRVILTGYADLQSSIDAVNQGKVFRFLTKPCEADALKMTLNSCIDQYRLIRSEKELLESTLTGCVEALTDVLSLANPSAFSRALRIRRYTLQLVNPLNLGSKWKFEIASLLSQLGCITLPPEIIEAKYRGEELTSTQRAAFDRHPAVTSELLKKIPRLQDIGWMIAQQSLPIGSYLTNAAEDLKLGADILRIAIVFDDLKILGVADAEAQSKLKFKARGLPQMVRCIESLHLGKESTEIKAVWISQLAVGMVLQEDVRTKSGSLIVVNGREITYPLMVRLANFHRLNEISDKVLVMCPRKDAAPECLTD